MTLYPLTTFATRIATIREDAATLIRNARSDLDFPRKRDSVLAYAAATARRDSADCEQYARRARREERATTFYGLARHHALVADLIERLR